MTELSVNSTPLEVRKAWAERLRNPGDIVQGTGSLAPSQNERCCLGVLGDLAIEAGVIDGYVASNGTPDIEVAHWVGLNPSYRTAISTEGGSTHSSLTLLNDYYHLTFADIADLLDDGLVLGPDGEVLQ